MTGHGPEHPKREFQLPRAADRLDDDIDAEFRFHLEERIEEFMAAGLGRADAEREARARFGDAEAHKSSARTIDAGTLRRERRADFLRTLARETRRAARVLVRDRTFALIAFLTLALGLGATTAIYTVLDAVVLRPLPYRDADRLVSVMHPATVPGSGERTWGLSPGGYFGFRNGMNALTDLGIYVSGGFTVTGDGDAEVVRSAGVTASVFSTLRAQPAQGRLLLADDNSPGAASVAVLSHEFHQRRYGGDPTVVGRNLETDIGTFEIVGIAEAGLALPMPGPFASSANLAAFGVDVWTPLRLDPAGPFFNNHPFVGIGRLRDGVTVADAQREFEALFRRITEDLPQVYSPRFLSQYNFRVAVADLRGAVLGPTVPRTIWLLFGSVLLVLTIAAANVGNLFLVRFEGRRREGALRAALGADRGQMAAHYLAETMLLCLTAAAAGIAFAWIGLRSLLAIAPTNVPRLASVTMDAHASLVALALAIVLGVVLGLVPLLRRSIDMGALRDGGRGLSASPRQRAARHVLVVAQLALTLVLLTAAGLMLRSFDQLRRVEPGFDAEGVLAFDLVLPFRRYDTREKAAVVHEQLQQRFAALPGVGAVGAGPTPLTDFGTGCSVVFRELRPFGPDEQTPCVATPTAMPGYFDALGIRVAGRVPTWSDVASRSQAAVITRSLAERLWPGEDPIGKGIASNGADSPVWYRIVGVIPQVRLEAFDLEPTEAIFYAATGLQANVRSGALNDMTYFVRSAAADPFAVLPAIREVVREIDPQIPVVGPRAMAHVVGGSMARTSFLLTLLGVAATVALILSAVGIYGVVSYLVVQRRTEIGIRMALGATVGGVVRLVVGQSARLAAAGVVLGALGALAVARVMGALLYGVAPNDPAVLSGVTLLVVVATLAASWGPARRAARVDPSEATREG